MKIKRIITVLCLLLCVTFSASADFVSLDTILAPLLEEQDTVNMTVSMQLKTLIPFDDTRIDLINRVLSHAVLNAQINAGSDKQNTAFQLMLGDNELLQAAEQCSDGAYLMQSSLLPNRMLFSTQASPMDALLAASAEEAAEEETTDNASDAEHAFDMLAAVDGLQSYYHTLIDQTVPLTKKNTPNYSIENIGKGRISYVAKLTTEQSDALLTELRTILSFGMDEQYCKELSQVTFAKGLVVALYQNKDAEDICVYIKGTMIYPDGDKRTMKWQWAFTPDHATQTFTYEAARESGTRDSRVINALLERTQKTDAYSISLETKTNLRRSSLNETSTYTLDLEGNLGDKKTCAGRIARLNSVAKSGKTKDEKETEITADLTLLPSDAGAEVSGTVSFQTIEDDKTRTALELTFISEVAEVMKAEAKTSSPIIVTVTSIDPLEAEQTAETPTTTAEEAKAKQSKFLIGMAPLGLYDYEIPADMMTINMDSTERKVHQSLMNEAAQRLAGNLITAILDLPAEDRELLSDGMTDEDYAIFLAMLD